MELESTRAAEGRNGDRNSGLRLDRSSSLVIERASLSHLDGMVECHRQSFPDMPMTRMGPGWLGYLYRHYLEATGGVSAVAMVDGHVIGLAVGGDPAIYSSYVKSAAMRFPFRLLGRFFTDGHIRRSMIALVVARLTERKARNTLEPKPSQERISSLLSFGVVPELRGKGVAMRLIEEYEQLSRAQGFTRGKLTVRRENARAIGFYKKAGWREVPWWQGASARLEKDLG